MAEQLTESTSFYRQVKNPNPEFIPEEGKKTLPFCEKIREKAAGFTRRMEFQTLVAMSIARGERKRRPPELRMRALEASLQALCHYFNPLANRVGASLTTMSIRCGLATEKKRLSITRFTGAVQFMAQLKLLTYNTEYDKEIGCNIPTDITFTPPRRRSPLPAAAASSGKTVSARRKVCRAPAPTNLSVPPGHLCANASANTRSRAVNTA